MVALPYDISGICGTVLCTVQYIHGYSTGVPVCVTVKNLRVKLLPAPREQQKETKRSAAIVLLERSRVSKRKHSDTHAAHTHAAHTHAAHTHAHPQSHARRMPHRVDPRRAEHAVLHHAVVPATERPGSAPCGPLERGWRGDALLPAAGFLQLDAVPELIAQNERQLLSQRVS